MSSKSDSPASTAADYSLRVLLPLAKWLEEKRGVEVLEKIASKADLVRADFDAGTKWVSHVQFETLLSAARAEMDSDEELKLACSYRFRDSYGPLRYMIWAFTPASLFDVAVKVSKMVTHVGRFETVESGLNHYTVRYYTKRPESRLVCLSRLGQWELGPTLWDLPPAQLEETKCVAHGDDCCEYRLKWFTRWRALPLLIGFLLGAIAATLIIWQDKNYVSSFTLPILGVAIAHMLELRRTSRLNTEMNQEMNNALRKLGEEEADARAEIVALQERQREWIGIMETEVTERTTALERIVDGLDGLQKNRVTTLRGFSHDLRNPLFVLKGNTQFLRDLVTEGEGVEAIRDMDAASDQIESMLLQLMELATHETTAQKLTPKRVVVASLADTLRRRLRALVFGRDIKVTAFLTREAPEFIDVDQLVFDRVIDNLLTNAAKYTERGSIILEVTSSILPTGAKGESEEYLTLKISDTGRGIDDERLQRVFRPRPSHEPSTRESRGVGLSSAVRLLAQIGGRLDVMSKKSVGTTFWAHFPRHAIENARVIAPDETFESVITRVVTIRKAAS